MDKEKKEKEEKVKKILLATGLTVAAIIAGAHHLKKKGKANVMKNGKIVEMKEMHPIHIGKTLQSRSKNIEMQPMNKRKKIGKVALPSVNYRMN